MRVVRIVAAVIGIAAVAGFVWWLFPSEESRVRARLAELAQAATIPPSEPDLARVSRIARLGGFLAEDAAVDFGAQVGVVTGRAALQGLAAQIAPLTGGLRVELRDVTVAIAGDRRTAAITARAVAAERAPDGRDITEARDVRMELVRTGREWMLSRATIAPSPDR
jgi:ketosteroid isomerase-like protein